MAYFGVAIPLLTADNLRLRRSAMVDRLTGAASRELLEQRAGEALQRAARSGSTVSLMAIDLDRFKQINDAHGHVQGDRVLAEVTRAVRGVLRSGDLFARFGGDDFAQMFERADEALYAAKRAGRDRLRIHTAAEPESPRYS